MHKFTVWRQYTAMSMCHYIWGVTVTEPYMTMPRWSNMKYIGPSFNSSIFKYKPKEPVIGRTDDTLLFLARTDTWERTSGISGVRTATVPSGISSSPLTLLAIKIVGRSYVLFWTASNSSTTSTYPTVSTGLITCQLFQEIRIVLASQQYQSNQIMTWQFKCAILYWRWNHWLKLNKHEESHLPRLAVFRSTGSSRFTRVDKEAADPARIISSVNISTCKRRYSGEKQEHKDRKIK